MKYNRNIKRHKSTATGGESNVGRYDGILLCSDFDSTLALNGIVSEENAKAIRYFQENGGMFTLISGRPPVHFKNFEELFKPNTYICGYNGAIISDIDEQEIVYQNFIRESLKEKHVRICRKISDINYFCLFYQGGIEYVPMDDVDYDRLWKTMDKDIYKIVYGVPTDISNEIKARIEEIIDDPSYVITRSSLRSIEVQNVEACKGQAAARLARIVGAKKLVCVGDFENDITMVESADVGYAVSNACESLKAVADKVTVDVKQHALAAIIEEIDAV